MFLGLLPIFGVILFAVIILAVVNAFYRFMINQEEAGNIKIRVKALADEAKSYRNDKDHTKRIYSEMMKEQNKLMKMTLKPMLISFIIVAALLPLMAISYNDQVSNIVNNTTVFSIDGTNYTAQVNGSLIIFDDKACEQPCKINLKGNTWHASIDGDKLKLGLVAAVLPFSMPFLGTDLGWIFWYIIVSIPLMIIIRKLYGIKI